MILTDVLKATPGWMLQVRVISPTGKTRTYGYTYPTKPAAVAAQRRVVSLGRLPRGGKP